VAPAAAKSSTSLIFKGLLKVIGSRLFAPVLESILAGRDVAAIKSATNISEKAKQELIGRRVVQGIAGVMGGAGGGIAGAALAASITGAIGAVFGTALGPIGTALLGAGGVIGGAFFGDLVGRKFATYVGEQVDGFRQVGALFHEDNAEREALNRATVESITGFNDATGESLNRFFNLSDVQENPDQFVGDFGGTGNLRTNLMNEAKLRELSRAQSVQDAMPKNQGNGGPTIVTDNSSSSNTEITNVTAPGDTTPSNPDPVPESQPLLPTGTG
jgi:hypothetical protein